MEKILVINSKIIQFSLALIERIQEIVKKHSLLLHTSNNEPFLENACCQSYKEESTLDYFVKQDQRIGEYNETVTQLANIMDDITSYSKSGLFYSDINTKNQYPSISNDFGEKTIYLTFINFCKFKSLLPIPTDLIPFCTSKPELNLLNPSDSIDRIIQKLKEDGRNYTNEQFLRLLQIISKHNMVNINIDDHEVSSITKLLKLLEAIDDENEEVLDKSLQSLIRNSLDSFELATEVYTKEVKEMNNFLIRNIESMKAELIDFVQKNTGPNITHSSVKKMVKTIENLSKWDSDDSLRNEDFKISDDKLYNIVNFYKTFIDNFVNIFPNIILNQVNYDEVFIPKYYGFSSNHSNKLKKNIGQYYENLKVFYGIPTLLNVLTTIQQTSKNLVLIANSTPSFTSIKIGEKVIKPVFDERSSKFLFEYYLLRTLINYIELSDEENMIVTEVSKTVEVTDLFSTDYLEETETRIDLSITTRNKTDTRLLTGNKKELRQKTAELLVAIIDIMNTQKEAIDISYETIQDKVFKLREREKDLVTDRLKKMSDEERNADTILKINNLGMYSKGLQKGLTTLDKNFYDEEQNFRDEMTKAERNIRKKNVDANDENMDILLNDYIEQQQNDKEIDDEANDMGFMNETYFDGNTDGVGAPEEEYNDYNEDN
jgi:DNA-binding protein H-NS